MPPPLLELDAVNTHYGAVQALRGVSLRVEAGQIVALLGANGAGKSTTLRTISALIRPSAGDIRFEGRSIVGMQPHRIVELGIAHVPEGRGVFANFTVAENLSIGAYPVRGGASSKAGTGGYDREAVLALFPRLRERLQQNAGTLSGGEQQMLAIGRALLAQPRLLLLDEPSLGLAPQVVADIFRIIREINAAGTTILLVEQNVHMALDAAHRGYVLEVGSITLHDEAAKLKTNDEVRKAYLGVA